MNLEEVLKSIPDKRQDKNTTSLKFKRDLISYLGDDYKDKVCLEIGTSKGYSTKILSYFFKKVITCENNTELLNFAKEVNKDRDNIEFLNKDVYNTPWDFSGIDVVFIDCNHEISYVLSDIRNAISLCEKNKDILLIFDDYGLDNPWEGVKEAIATYNDDERFDIIKEIGEPKGSDCNPRALLRDVEGVICRYLDLSKQTFTRIIDNKLYSAGEVYRLGFDKSAGLRIPDEYLRKGEFVVMRTAHVIGDWGILSAMPKLLKQKYPSCKVYIPSKNLISNLFGDVGDNAYNVFVNNPYVDEFIDNTNDEIFHDHYRIYDKENTDIPLLKQMLEFWQFSEEEMKDSQPEVYWSDEEKKLGDEIIKEYVGDKDFGCLLLSNRFGTQYGKYDEKSYNNDYNKTSELLEENQLPYFYWSYKPLEEIGFDSVDKALDMKHINLRIQLYIKSKAKVNISNQCGANHMVVRYSKCYEIQRQFPIAHNFVDGEIYV